MYSIIIIAGLAVGLAASLIIAQYVRFELSFDKQSKDSDRMFYTYISWRDANGVIDGECHPAVAPAILRSIPEVESSVRIVPFTWTSAEVVLKREENGKTIFYSRIDRAFGVDPEVLDFFSVPMVEGTRKGVLENHQSVVITRRIAEKFFPNESAMNKVLKFSYYGEAVDIKVTAIAENPPANSSFQFDILVLMYSRKEMENLWAWGIFKTFVKLHAGTDPLLVEKKINEIAATPIRATQKDTNTTQSIHLFPFKDYHFYEPYNHGVSTVRFTGDRKIINYFILLGVIILVISWVNYINLTTAR